mmetsp:Transcript_603/g.798  ORF Transcript_603/g.798 Transcript_603/m.798 type:complete len:113 (+) Transcript_603:339-677(+)
MGYPDLPVLPRKKVNLFMSPADQEERQRGLELYLKALVNRKDTRNSRALVEFLNLYETCPEIMYNVPQLIIKREFQREFVNCCLFLEAHNLYVLAITDKASKSSRFEIYAFR